MTRRVWLTRPVHEIGYGYSETALAEAPWGS